MKLYYRDSLSCTPVVEVTQEWFKWHSIDELAVHWHILISIEGDLVQVDLEWHSDFAVAQWQCIGWTQIWLMPNILLKSRPLIGRELGILASDWSRGLSENVQRGYPYDPENLPMDHFWNFSINWQSSGSQIAVKWQSSGSWVTVMWQLSDSQVTVNWQSIGSRCSGSSF